MPNANIAVSNEDIIEYGTKLGQGPDNEPQLPPFILEYERWYEGFRFNSGNYYQISKLTEFLEFIGSRTVRGEIANLLWSIIHCRSYHTTNRMAEFIDDCLTFIMTGERLVPLTTWRILITDIEDYMSPREYEDLANRLLMKTEDVASLTSNSSWSTYITMWCSKPNGFRDMVDTMYLVTQFMKASHGGRFQY